ncbi:MAG: TonB C-terminal domain-containing protein [Steroidobacteraceae bacterium]
MADRRNLRNAVARIGGGLFGLVLVMCFIWFVRMMMNSKVSGPERKTQIVTLIQPPPPPPDQPPPPPPPEKQPEELPKDVPEPKPEEQQQAPAPNLGIDAEGTAGGDSFGLAARSGGSDLIGGSGTAPFAWYTNRISDAIKDRLAAAPCTKTAKGSLTVHVLMEADGRVKQIKLATTTGDPKIDSCIDSALGAITRIGDPVPPGMPEQINLRIVSRI